MSIENENKEAINEENNPTEEKMPPKKFFEIWKKACEESKTILSNNWYNGSKAYTCAVLCENNNESVISRIKQQIKTFGYEVYQEYYHCDVVFYKDAYRVKEITPWISKNGSKKISGTWLRQIEIHLEHENDSKKSWEELTQLLVLPGKKLNVLVTYPDKKDDNTVKKAYENILQSVAVTTPLLVIFGYSAGKEKKHRMERF